MPQVADKAREECAKGRDMRVAATAAATTKCTAQLWARNERRTGSYLDMNFDVRGRSGSEMGVQLFNDHGQIRKKNVMICVTRVSRVTSDTDIIRMCMLRCRELNVCMHQWLVCSARLTLVTLSLVRLFIMND